jgi:large subunit ribosomal protein L25
MADIVLNVEVRERTGTGGSRETRRDGRVPGILYGGSKEPVALSVKSNEFRKALYTGKLLGHLVKLQNGSETQSVIAKDVQLHPVTDEPIHFDFFRVDENQQIKVSVAVHFKNQDISPGLKRGGTLNIVRHDVELMAPAGSIPDDLVFDVGALDIGDTVRIGSIELPKGVTASVDRDFVIATIAGTSAQAAEDAAADQAEGGEA